MPRAFVTKFGAFEVSFESGEMRKSGMRIRVQQQPLKVLQILLETPGELVTRDELRQRLWTNDSFGDFDQAVNIAIGKLRSALGDSADNPRYIETLPKRGYRFIAEVSIVSTEDRLDEPPTSPSMPVTQASAQDYAGQQAFRAVLPAGNETDSRRRPRWATPSTVVIGTLSLVVLTLVFVAMFVWARRPTDIHSLAVLPLDNLSGDPSQDYFADGMTDELITDLAKIKALRVVSRTSIMTYKKTGKSLPEIAKELSVDAIVQGSVFRSGDQVRITAQLIALPVEKHLWADSYQRSLRDTLAVQNQVARTIADKIRIEVSPLEQAELRSDKTIDPEAHEAYLRGRYAWNTRTADGLKKSVDFFNDAIAKDPNYATAYSGLADSYALLGDWEFAVMPANVAMPRAIAAARKALELDDGLGEAHASLAFCLDGFNYDFAAADAEFRRALELSPGYATAHHWYAWHLSLLGRNSEAIAEMKRAENLDPVSPAVNADLAELLLIAHLPEESIEQSRKTIEMNPGFAFAHNQLAQAFIEKQMYGEATAELREAIRLAGDNPIFVANLARAYAGSGQRTKAAGLLSDLKKRSNSTSPLSVEIAMIYTALDDKDQAIDWLANGYHERFNPGVLERPFFDGLRSDARFQKLEQDIGYPPHMP